MLITEFAKAFLYINRHLLYTETSLINPNDDDVADGSSIGITKKALKKSLQSTMAKNYMSESVRDYTEDHEMLMTESPEPKVSHDNSVSKSAKRSRRDLSVKKSNSVLEETR